MLVASSLTSTTIALAEDEYDLDGDGDIDDADRAALKAAEVISVEDKSATTQQRESARAVTVIDLHRARERAADLGEVLSRTHGLQVRRSGALGSATRFSLNGLYDEQIRFFVDGIPLDYAGWSTGIANIPVNLIDRVDVYRGVVPVQLGADALGGAIDLVTDPSWVDKAALSYQIGSFGTHRATVAGRVRDDATGLALGVTAFTDVARNDYPIDVQVVDDSGRLTPATVRRFHDRYVAGGTIVEAGIVQRGPIERALLRAFHTQYAKQLQHNAVMTVPYGEAHYAGVGRGLIGDVHVGATAWRARVVLGAARTSTDFEDVATAVYDWYGRRVADRRVAGEIGMLPIDQRVDELGLFGRATIERALGSSHRLRLAIAPTRHTRSGRDFFDPNPDGRDPIEAKRKLWQLVSGLEHQAASADDRLVNIAFAKYYLHSADAEQARPGFVFLPIAGSFHRFGAGNSLRYRASATVALKASYEWATRIPSPDELFGDGVLVEDNLDLAPESSHNANAGVLFDHEGRTGAWGGEVSAFARLADDLIVLLGNDRVFSYQNVYAARVLGIEGSAGWISPGNVANVEANVTLQDIRNTSNEGTFAMFDGDRIPNRPWLLASVAASLRRRGTLRRDDEIAVFTASRYVHEFFRGWASLGAREYKQVVPSQLVHSVGITYAARGESAITTTLELQNITDARVYDSFGVQRPGRAVYLKLTAEL